MEVTEYAGKAVWIYGFGVTGRAVARALRDGGGTEVYGFDRNPQRLEEAAADFGVIPVEPDAIPESIAAVVVSPGIPDSDPILYQVRQRGFFITSEIDLAYRANPSARYVFVTGTNGKSTCVSLLAHLLNHCGYTAYACGNLGTPLLDVPSPADGESPIYVVEMSSYQLHRMTEACCGVAIWLNISPDHLEYHATMAGYYRAKLKIFGNFPRLSIIGQDDALSRAATEALMAQNNFVLPVSARDQLSLGIVLNAEGKLVERLDTSEPPVMIGPETSEGWPNLRGQHNMANVAAAWAAARAFLCAPEQLKTALSLYPGLPHRMQEVSRQRCAGGTVVFINDSKATNPESTIPALAAFRRVIWLAGGQMKEGSGYAALFAAANRGGVEGVVLYGEAAENLASLAKSRDVRVVSDFASAVEQAHRLAVDVLRNSAADAGEEVVVLLSPACASFDQFANFGARGDAFIQIVTQAALS